MYRTKLSPLSIIVAVDEDGGFGKKGKIPWNIPEDMKHFMSTTKDSICIMGRKTYQDMLKMTRARRKKNKIKGKIKSILPNRECYVVTSNEEFKAPGATVVQSIKGAIQKIKNDDSREVFVLGGYRMYVEAMAFADTVYMTIVKGDTYDCDVFFPIQSLDKFKINKGKETEELYFVTYTR